MYIKLLKMKYKTLKFHFDKLKHNECFNCIFIYCDKKDQTKKDQIKKDQTKKDQIKKDLERDYNYNLVISELIVLNEIKTIREKISYESAEKNNLNKNDNYIII